MLVLFLASLVLRQKNVMQSSLKPILDKGLFVASYDRTYPVSSGAYHFGYIRTVNARDLSFTVSVARSQSDVIGTHEGLRSAASDPPQERSPSNIQLGDYCYILFDEGGITTSGDGYCVAVRILHGAFDPLPQSDKRLEEALARVGLAECIGSVLHEDGTAMNHPGSAIEHTHKTYVPLPEIAKRNKLKSTVGEWFDRCTVDFKGHTLEFALGSDWASIDGKILTLEAFVARKNGVWMIPTAVLRRNGFPSF